MTLVGFVSDLGLNCFELMGWEHGKKCVINEEILTPQFLVVFTITRVLDSLKKMNFGLHVTSSLTIMFYYFLIA